MPALVFLCHTQYESDDTGLCRYGMDYVKVF